MKTFIKTITFLALSILFISCHGSEIPAPNLLTDDTPQIINRPKKDHVSWSDDLLPLPLVLDEKFNNNELLALDDMSLAWEISIDNLLHFFETPYAIATNPSYEDLEDYRDDEMGIYKSYRWYPEVGGFVLALTQYFGFRDGQHIDLFHGDILFNFRDHNFSTDGSENTYDFASVALHELGHLVGLLHQNNYFTPSVMHPTISMNSIKRELEEYDRLSLLKNYNIANGDNSLRALTFSRSVPHPEDGELVRGIIELRVDGQCLHYINGEQIYIHYVSIDENRQ